MRCDIEDNDCTHAHTYTQRHTCDCRKTPLNTQRDVKVSRHVHPQAEELCGVICYWTTWRNRGEVVTGECSGLQQTLAAAQRGCQLAMILLPKGQNRLFDIAFKNDPYGHSDLYLTDLYERFLTCHPQG